LEEIEHAQLILYVELDAKQVFVQFVKYNLFVVFTLRVLYKNSKHTILGS